MIGLLFGILLQISGVLFTISTKSITKTIGSRGALSTHLFFIPIGIIGGIISYYFNSEILSYDLIKYFLLVFAFGLVVSFNMYLGFSLLKNTNTSSYFKYKVGITMTLALISDFLFFNEIPTFLSIIIGIIFIFSGNFLNTIKQKDAKRKTILKLIIMSFGIIISSSILKEIVLISNNEFLSIFVTQTITQIIVGLFGIKYFSEVLKNTKIIKLGIIHCFLLLALILIEFYAYKYLSLFLLMALSNIKFIFYLGFDLIKKELEINRNTIIGTMIGFLGIGLLIFDKI